MTDNLITVRCPVCSAELRQPPKNTDPWETVTILMACASCTTKPATLHNCTYLDAQGRELDAITFEGR